MPTCQILSNVMWQHLYLTLKSWDLHDYFVTCSGKRKATTCLSVCLFHRFSNINSVTVENRCTASDSFSVSARRGQGTFLAFCPKAVYNILLILSLSLNVKEFWNLVSIDDVTGKDENTFLTQSGQWPDFMRHLVEIKNRYRKIKM